MPTDDDQMPLRQAPPGLQGVVGVGASAGGLSAVEAFLGAVPADCPLAFLVVFHLDPTKRSMLVPLLKRATTLRVCEAENGAELEAGTVFVIPPNTVMTVRAGHLRLDAPDAVRARRHPVDELFVSLAEEWRSSASGVVLSGMGSDGTEGLRAIRKAGGTTMAQLPATAQFDSMVLSAIHADCVDVVAPPAELPGRLLARLACMPLVEHPFPDAAEPAAPPSPAGPPGSAGPSPVGLEAILGLLVRRGKHDFSLYKRSTLLRRIERRIGIHRLHSMAEYLRLLEANPQEVDLLFKELLIGVTAFFRDTAVWQALGQEVLPALLRAHPDGHRLRAWVAGCSTGEEAYSLAMSFVEAVEKLPERGRSTLQIFATDLSKDAIEFARRATFPAGVAREMSAERLARFFVPLGDGLRVSKRIREMVVFAPHDLTADPPFTKLDLLSCRNLLIYLTAPLQKRLMPLFHYSLRAGGVLLLGSSETVGRFEDLFDPIDARVRLYRKRERPDSRVIPDFPLRMPFTESESTKGSPLSDERVMLNDIQGAAERLILEELASPALLVNERGDVVFISGRTGRYLEPAAGKANWNIHVMLRPDLREPLATALLQVAGQRGPIELPGLKVTPAGRDGAHLVDVSLRVLDKPAELKGLTLVAFKESVRPRASRRRTPAGEVAGDVDIRLQAAREEAQALREEMRASQEELQASNEELQSTNEELQSTNEELTSSKEEMQSMNEELQAVNAELQAKLDDLAMAQSDMRNLLNSTDIATLFLDQELHVRRFTERARKIFSLRDTDIGRPLSDLSSTLDYPELSEDVREMLRTLVVAEREVAGADGQRYSVRVMPYRTQDDVIQGAVITFVLRSPAVPPVGAVPPAAPAAPAAPAVPAAPAPPAAPG